MQNSETLVISAKNILSALIVIVSTKPKNLSQDNPCFQNNLLADNFDRSLFTSQELKILLLPDVFASFSFLVPVSVVSPAFRLLLLHAASVSCYAYTPWSSRLSLM